MADKSIDAPFKEKTISRPSMEQSASFFPSADVAIFDNADWGQSSTSGCPQYPGAASNAASQEQKSILILTPANPAYIPEHQNLITAPRPRSRQK
jgi:hypothetical protein